MTKHEERVWRAGNDGRGLAHFLEHMAFNGTKNFPGKGKRPGIVPWCESIGVKFGANLNAYTSIDQTVYHIGSAPLKREGIIDSCLLVLHDWSHYLLLEDKEIDKERGVIHEEWRNRRSGMAVQRLMESAMPKVYKGTKYEDCLPIGYMDIVDNFPYKDLRDYYHKWYRPDLQAIVVVGDIDVDKMEKKIKRTFASIPMPKNPAKRIYYPVADNDSMIVAIEKDAEQPIVLCHIYQKREATPDDKKDSEEYLRGDYIDGLITSMLNDRYAELRYQTGSPVQSASAHASSFFMSRTKDAFSMSISCKQDNIFGGIIAAVGIAEQARQHGFTELTLSNGMKVYARKTDYSNDAVSLRMEAEGGTSLYGDEDIPNFSLITSAATEGGVGTFDEMTLRKMLTGKTASVSPSVGTRSQSISGSASVKDMKTMFELAYLYFTQPRKDTLAFREFINRNRAFLTNRNASPKVDYNDSIRAILYGHNPRMEPVVQSTLDKVSYDRIMQIYKERFSDASNFKAVVIGNYDEQELRRMLCQYLATLPSAGKHEKANEANVPQIVGGKSVHKFTKKQATPLANVSIYYTADVPFTAKSDLELDFLKRCLSIAYTDSVREEKGGTYGVSVDFDLDNDDKPNATLVISYKGDPKRYDELTPIIYMQLQHIADHGPAESSIRKVKEYLKKQYQQAAITNDYWSYIVWHELNDGIDFDINYCKMVDDITAADIQRMAKRILDAKRCTEVTMLSE